MIAKNSARIAALAFLPAAVALSMASPAMAAGTTHQVDLAPLNNSGAHGTAMLMLDGTRLTVKIEADGLVPNAPHAQHIHGSTTGMDFHCPDASADKNGDKIVSTTEGMPAYGDINISLTTDGDTTKASGLAVDRMPKADAKGHLSYSRTITVSPDVVTHIKDLHVVQHGIDVNKDGTYDTGAGPSDLDPKLPQEATAPADCGMVKGAAMDSVPVGGVETGSGTTRGIEQPTMLGAGIGLIGAAGLLVVLRRRTNTEH